MRRSRVRLPTATCAIVVGNWGMSGMTVTRADLTEAVYQEVGLSSKESGQLVESVLEEIVSTLAQGESVRISRIGTFSVRGGRFRR